MYGVTSIWLNNNRIHALPPGVFGSDRKGIKDEKKSMYVTAEGFGKQSMPTNHAKEKPDIKENIKLSPKNITV